MRAPLPGVGAGSIVELEIVTTDRMPWFDAGIAGRYYLWNSVPLRKTRLILDAPASLPLKFVARGRGVPRPVTAQSGGRRTHTFEGGPYPATPRLPTGTPPEDQLPPHIGYTTGQGWARVATRYAAIVEEQLRGVDVGAWVREATRGASGRADTIVRLVAALRRDVRYTGVEFGDASIVPRPPAAVLERRYGDCKDMALLLVAMLRAAGIEAHVVLLRAGFNADVDEELPGFGFFNHAIVHVPGGGTAGGAGASRIDSRIDSWIDPSARFTPPGELPPADQGRRALIARTGTTALVKTPVAPPAQNLVREEREIQLDEEGTARVHETSEARGAIAESYRSAYNDTARSAHEKKLTEYARKVYGAPSLKRVSWSEPTDLSGPFRLELEAEGATPAPRRQRERHDLPRHPRPPSRSCPRRCGETTRRRRRARRRARSITSTRSGTATRSGGASCRRHGYAPEPPPPPRRITLGPATLEVTLATTPDGAATATVTFDSGRARLSPAELTTFQKTLRELRQERAMALRFVHTGQAHLAAGRVREALAEFRRLQAAHPDAVLHRTQIARAYLAAGLGEAARREAQKAVAAAPRSLEAQMTLGWVLEHDLIGRRLLPGADRAGAERAYRQVIALDPKAYGARASLAILFEHDPRGGHTWPRERLADAIAEYDVLHEAGLSDYDLNHALALFRLERWPAAAALARKLGTTEGNALVLAVTLLTQGSAAAFRELQTLVPEAGKRAEVLRLAGVELVHLRRYPEAGMLLTEAAARGHENAAALRAQGVVLARGPALRGRAARPAGSQGGRAGGHGAPRDRERGQRPAQPGGAALAARAAALSDPHPRAGVAAELLPRPAQQRPPGGGLAEPGARRHPVRGRSVHRGTTPVGLSRAHPQRVAGAAGTAHRRSARRWLSRARAARERRGPDRRRGPAPRRGRRSRRRTADARLGGRGGSGGHGGGAAVRLVPAPPLAPWHPGRRGHDSAAPPPWPRRATQRPIGRTRPWWPRSRAAAMARTRTRRSSHPSWRSAKCCADKGAGETRRPWQRGCSPCTRNRVWPSS